ncbi:MAG: radical SAM protein [Deltaproteobacteria bacterium]|nr:radical SAM protein [Deltaproteobacteria bacterium]
MGIICSFNRGCNGCLAFVSKKSSMAKVFNRPRALMVEPTNYCNLSCPLCPTGSGELGVPRGYMDTQKYKALVDELAPYLEEMNLWGFGEPMLHKDIYEMISYASAKGIDTRISTNGHFFKTKRDAEHVVESGLYKMRISLDGVSQETLVKYRRNASFESILDGIRRINKIKKLKKTKKPILVFQFIVMKHNEHEIDKASKMATELKMRLVLKPVSVGRTLEEATAYLPDNKNYSKYDYGNDKIVKGAGVPQPRICPFPWDWAHVNWDGSVVPCCKDPQRQHPLGNAFEQGGFLKIWNSKEYVRFRKIYLTDRSLHALCKKCVLPAKV